MTCPTCGVPVSDSEIIESMREPSNGSFCNKLAEAASVADSMNLRRIKMVFCALWNVHRMRVRDRKCSEDKR